MAAAGFWLGPPGQLVQLPQPLPGIEAGRTRRGAVHELAGGGAVVDVTGRGRAYRLSYDSLTADELAVLEQLAGLPGPYRLIDSNRRNYLTANQSSGTDALADATGFSAFTQGSVASSTAQARTRSRSLAWSTVTALGATGRGIRLMTDPAAATPDATWAAGRAGVTYTVSSYVRTSAAVSMQPGINFYSATPALLQSNSGAGVAVSTSDWTTRLSFADTAPAGTAYVIGKFFNTTTTGAAITVFFDDLQLEEAGSASAAVLGTGTPIVAIDQLSDTYPLADYYSPELTLIELS
jgi:hypothetical protein